MATIQLLPKQKGFLRSRKKTVLFLAGIGSGKTFAAGAKAVELLLSGAYVVCTANSYKQLKLVLFQEIKDHLRKHGVDYIEYKADMVLDVPITGGKIYGFSGDSIENVRGITADCAIMDEAALQDRYVYEVVFGRLRRGVVPLQVFITTTPRGRRNWIYKLAIEPDVDLFHQATADNVFLPEEYVTELTKQYSGDFAKQELAGEFVDGDGAEQLISITDINAASVRKPMETDEPLMAGLDVARYGDDNSALVFRKGNEIIAWKKFGSMSTKRLADHVVDMVIIHKPEALAIDGCGLGGGVVDELVERLENYCDILEYNGAHKALNPMKYMNARAESWVQLRDWVKSSGNIPSALDFEELADLNYFIDSKGRYAMESKEILRRKGLDSPDLGDALSMTLADKTYLTKKKADKIKESFTKKKGRRRGFAG